MKKTKMQYRSKTKELVWPFFFKSNYYGTFYECSMEEELFLSKNSSEYQYVTAFN